MARPERGSRKTLKIPSRSVDHTWQGEHNKHMKLLSTVDQIKKGGRIVYNDGRPGHSGAVATVLAVAPKGMTVQFEDRADTSSIAFGDRRWMDFIETAD